MDLLGSVFSGVTLLVAVVQLYQYRNEQRHYNRVNLLIALKESILVDIQHKEKVLDDLKQGDKPYTALAMQINNTLRPKLHEVQERLAAELSQTGNADLEPIAKTVFTKTKN